MSVTAPAGLIARASLALGTPYAAPADDLEVLIAKIFADVFGLDQVGVNDDFFDLGGDSLLGEVLSMSICQQAKYDFKPSSLLEYGSPRRIAELLVKNSSSHIGASILPEAAKPPIFVVHGRGGFTLPGRAFFEALAPGQRLRMFELPGIRGGPCYDRIEDIAAHYVGLLSEEYPQGPTLLAAFCAGALIAVEMACQLDKLGRPVSQVVLLDPPIRNGTLGVGRIVRDGRGGPHESHLKVMLRRLLPIRALCRYHELKYQMLLVRKKQEGSIKYAEFGFYTKPQAKLYVAFLRYQPRAYSGPVTILSSYGSSRAFRGGTSLMALLPNLSVQLISEQHHGIGNNATAARAMLAVFDAALSKASELGRPETPPIATRTSLVRPQ
jgi:hypothetical protein